MSKGFINRTAAQDLKINKSVNIKLEFVFLHLYKKIGFFYVLQKTLLVALPVNAHRREAHQSL